MIKTLISIVAKNPPSIAIAMAGVLALVGHMDTAVIFLAAGILLQALWLLKCQRG